MLQTQNILFSLSCPNAHANVHGCTSSIISFRNDLSYPRDLRSIYINNLIPQFRKSFVRRVWLLFITTTTNLINTVTMRTTSI